MTMWLRVSGVVHHVCMARADAALWAESIGARWTGYIPNRYGLIVAVHVNLMVASEREIPQPAA